ncbi:MAG: O-antigen ligase family protein [Candidatus Omnitrophota bacterium]
MKSHIRTWAWRVILAYIFIRPMISDINMQNADFVITGAFLIAVCAFFTPKSPVRAPIDKRVYAFILALFLSLIFSADRLNTMTVFYKYFAFTGLFFACRILSENEEKTLTAAVIAGAIFLAIYSLRSVFVVSVRTLQYMAENNIRYPFAVEFISRKRAFFPFILPSILASYLVAVIPVSAGLVFNRMKDKSKDLLFYAGILCFVLCASLLFLTRSISGWITFLISAFTFMTLARKVNRKTILVLALIAVILASLWYMRTHESKVFTHPLFSIKTRLAYWAGTVSIIRTHILTGTGLGNFSLPSTLYAHNSYLQIWAEMGLFGIITWLAIVFAFVGKGLRRIRDNRSDYYTIGIFTGGLAFLIINLTEFSFFCPQAAFLWWVILGITANRKEPQPA